MLQKMPTFLRAIYSCKHPVRSGQCPGQCRGCFLQVATKSIWISVIFANILPLSRICCQCSFFQVFAASSCSLHKTIRKAAGLFSSSPFNPSGHNQEWKTLRWASVKRHSRGTSISKWIWVWRLWHAPILRVIVFFFWIGCFARANRFVSQSGLDSLCKLDPFLSFLREPFCTPRGYLQALVFGFTYRPIMCFKLSQYRFWLGIRGSDPVLRFWLDNFRQPGFCWINTPITVTNLPFC